MRPRGIERSFIAAAAALLLAALPGARAGVGVGVATTDWAPTPFHATYAVQWKGLNAGTSKLELRRMGSDTWIYDSRNNARGIFRLAIPDTVRQTSELRYADGRVQPLHFRGDDGGEATNRDVSLDFDWQRGRITGVAEDKKVDLAAPADVQDPMSVQLVQMHAAATGQVPQRMHTVDKDEIKEYDFTREGTQRLTTALGEIDTVIFESRRPGSSRVIRLWMAPSLGYLPVRAERHRGEKLEFTMAIREYRRD
ncbi:MAG: DUF3108 domain-containing protein [Steroidobacteraceae bacterium]